MGMIKNSRKKENRRILLIAAILFSFSFAVYGPIELYLTNINEFWFSLSQFWFVLLGMGVVIASTIYLIGYKMRLWLQNIYIGIISGISIFMYVQSNFMNMDIGVLNGGNVSWSEYRIDFAINFFIWLGGICVVVCLFNENNQIFRRVVKYVCASLIILQLITMSVLLLTVKSNADKGKISYYVSNKDIYELSTDENIVVFLLDMFDDRYFKELIVQEPSLTEQFEGFTQYVNSTGNYSATSYSVGALLTGQYLRNEEETFYGEITSKFEKCKMYDLLLENNYKLDLYTYSSMMPDALKEKTSNYIMGGRKISDYLEFTQALYRLTASRYFPDFMKQYTWLVGTEFDSLCERTGEADAHSVDNVDFYNDLLGSGIYTQDEKKCFKFIHIDAVHYPYRMNENVERVETDAETSDLKCARGVLKIVQAYMDGMKETGTFDNSSIIIMADHGYYWDGTLCNPVLLVKPKNSNGKMQVSNAPVSHHDFQATVLSLAGLNDNNIYGKAYSDIEEGENRERLFYQYYLQEDGYGEKHRLIEYSIDSKSNERSSFKLTGNEYTLEGQLINHFEHCKYCRNNNIETENNDNTARIVHQ